MTCGVLYLQPRRHPYTVYKVNSLVYLTTIMMIVECAWYYAAVNLALNKSTVQSSTQEKSVASLAVDNDTTSSACTSNDKSSEPWWAVDLGEAIDVGRVCVVNDNHSLGQFLADHSTLLLWYTYYMREDAHLCTMVTG